MADRQTVVHARLSRLTGGFARYVTAYDELVPFSSEQLSAHRRCIALRQQAGSLTAAVSNARFVASPRRTLIAWGIGGRASYLMPEAVFTQALAAAAPELEVLEGLRVDAPDLPADTAERL